MAQTLALYGTIHQPLPLRLPAQPILPEAGAADLERSLFDTVCAEHIFSEFIIPAYSTAVPALCSLTEEGVPLSVGVSDGFLDLARRWAGSLIKPIRQLLQAPLVEAVATEPVRGLLFAFDLREFADLMAESRRRLAEWAHKPVEAAEISGFCLNHEIYHALGGVGFAAILAASEDYAGQSHHPCRPSAWGENPVVLYRLSWLSEELGYRLRAAAPEPERMADTIAGLPGEVALITFDLDDLAFSSRGGMAAAEMLGALAAACGRRGVELRTVSEAAAGAGLYALREQPPTLTVGADFLVERFWRDGWWERLIFGRMQQACGVTSLLQDRSLKAVGRQLLQRANLTAPRWGADLAGRPPTYWRGLWWEQPHSYDDTAGQVVAVYDNFVRAAARQISQEGMG